ncbi:MAG: hypothetical protein ABEJ04_03375 [Halobacteriaceae archaeon]
MTRKRSVALVAFADPAARERPLLVRRPEDDEDLPGAWGLPAATRAEGERGESWTACVERAGREKLGVAVDPVETLNEGRLDRAAYALRMRLYEVRVRAGTPSVPQSRADVTQYADWRWGTASDLVPAAEAGSLCSALYLDWAGCDFDAPPTFRTAGT